jgi:hypothetical protein
MPDTYEEVEAKIQSIIDAIPPNFKPNLSRLAREKKGFLSSADSTLSWPPKPL